MTQAELEAILGRPERVPLIGEPLTALLNHRVLVTGANGSIGRELVDVLDVAGVDVHATDIGFLDVRHPANFDHWEYLLAPTVVFHLAGAKHAPQGEADPWGVAYTNAVGTRNVLQKWGTRRVVLASTCKAADPETAYGASKLIAERMTLNAGGSVARYFNVVETQGNVFETWRELPESAPIPVTPCSRYFISLREAVALTLWAAVLPAGRYALDVGQKRRSMWQVASELYPGRKRVLIPARRGDRDTEPFRAQSEWEETIGVGGVVQVKSLHDPA